MGAAEQRVHRRGRLRSILYWAAAGAALAYFFDPERGRGRRNQTRDQLMAALRRANNQLSRQGRHAYHEAYGAYQRASHSLRQSEQVEIPDDVTLSRKVESHIFRDPNVPKGHISVNAEGGIVFLRGSVDSYEQINGIQQMTRKVPGVVDVMNLLHLPGTPPLNTAEARSAESRRIGGSTG